MEFIKRMFENVKIKDPATLLLLLFLSLVFVSRLAVAVEEKAETTVTKPSVEVKKELNIFYLNGAISVDIKSASIGDIFKELNKYTGINYEIEKEIMDKKTTIAFEEKGLIEGIKEILNTIGNPSYVMIYKKDKDGKFRLSVEIKKRGKEDTTVQVGKPEARQGEEEIRFTDGEYVDNGAVIIDGRYIRPPYLVEARDNGVWINGVLADKIGVLRKDHYKERKEGNLKWAVSEKIYPEYLALGEEIGWEKAAEKIKIDLQKNGEVEGVKIKKLNAEKNEKTEIIVIQFDIGDGYEIKLEIPPSEKLERELVSQTIHKKRDEIHETPGHDQKESYNDLLKFLDGQKGKGRIIEYTTPPLTVKYKGSDIKEWFYSPGVFGDTTILSDEEGDRLDQKDLEDKQGYIIGGLRNNRFLVFSKGSMNSSTSSGRETIEKLNKIVNNSKLNFEEKKNEIKKIYPEDEKHLKEMLENFNK